MSDASEESKEPPIGLLSEVDPLARFYKKFLESDWLSENLSDLQVAGISDLQVAEPLEETKSVTRGVLLRKGMPPKLVDLRRVQAKWDDSDAINTLSVKLAVLTDHIETLDRRTASLQQEPDNPIRDVRDTSAASAWTVRTSSDVLGDGPPGPSPG